MAAIAGRTIHAYHVEGVGGGHIPDLIGIVREPNVICSSTTPGLPYARATAAEHADMILIVHEGNPRARRRTWRRRASGSTRRRWPPRGRCTIWARSRSSTATPGHGPDRRDRPPHVAARPRDEGVARLGGGTGWPNEPVPTTTSGSCATWPRYTAEPARVARRRGEVGSLAPGHLADLVLWEPASFGAKPVAVMKGGRRRLGTDRRGQRLGARRRADAVRSRLGRHRRCGRGVGDDVRLGRRAGRRDRRDARHPPPGGRRRRARAASCGRPGREHGGAAVEVSTIDGTVSLDGRVLAADRSREVPLNRRYFLS